MVSDGRLGDILPTRTMCLFLDVEEWNVIFPSHTDIRGRTACGHQPENLSLVWMSDLFQSSWKDVAVGKKKTPNPWSLITLRWFVFQFVSFQNVRNNRRLKRNKLYDVNRSEWKQNIYLVKLKAFVSVIAIPNYPKFYNKSSAKGALLIKRTFVVTFPFCFCCHSAAVRFKPLSEPTLHEW